jgi:hypothetical protein
MSGAFLRHVVALPLFNSHDQAVFVNPHNAARAGLVRGYDIDASLTIPSYM